MVTTRSVHHLRSIGERVRAPLRAELPSPHLELEWRRLGTVDAGHLAALVKEADEAEGAVLEAPASVLIDLVERDDDGPFDTLGGFDRAGVLRAYAGVLLWPAGDVPTVVFYGAVDPAWNGRGLGRALLAWQEGRARQLLSGVPGSGPARLSAFVEEAAAERRRLYVAGGFSPKTTFVRMRRDLNAPIPAPEFPADLEILPALSLPEAAVREAHVAAAHHTWGVGPLTPDLWHRVWERYRPEWSFAVVDPSEGAQVVVGYALCMPHTETMAPTVRTEGSISRLGVVPDHRARGIGRALACHVLRAFADSGVRFATILAEPDVEHSGFALWDDLGFASTTRAMVYGLNL